MNLKIIGCKIYFKVITQMYLSEQNPQMENPSCTNKLTLQFGIGNYILNPLI